MSHTLTNIPRTVRSIRRAQEILRVLVAFGFADVVQELNLDRILLKGKRRIGLARPDATVTRLPTAVRLRKVMESLGPTFIKMAQILSTRPDLIPREWADEFAKLQAGVPAVGEAEILAHLETIYGKPLDEVFASVDGKATAAASIAQAHKAELKDGTHVMLKVLRPGIEKTVEADIEILTVLASLIERHFSDLGYSPTQVVDQFARQIRKELDLIHEGQATERMNRSFQEDPHVAFPEVYWAYTRKSVLCLERIEGILLADKPRDTLTREQLCKVVEYGTNAVFRQCFEIGFFHADPHPGNIFVVPLKEHQTDAATTGTDEDGKGDDAPVIAPGDDLKLVFIDCGMTGHIDPHTAELLADLVQSTITGQLERVMDVILAMTDASPAILLDRSVRADTWEFISHFDSAKLTDLHMGALLSEFFEKLRRNHLQCPADIVYLVKAVTTIEGVGEELCPEFELVEHVRPHIDKLVRRRYGFGAIRHRVEQGTLAYAEFIEMLPRAVRGLFYRIGRDQINFTIRHEGLDRITRELERASRNIALALVVSALVVSGAILLMADAVAKNGHSVLFYGGVVSFIVAAALALVRFLSSGPKMRP